MYQALKTKSALHLILFLLLAILISNNSAADLILSAPPREPGPQANEMYQPIAERLTEILGEPVIYQRPNGWFAYSKNMRDNKYDIIFDGPHFTAWRVKHLKHIPVATLPGSLKFFLVTRKTDTTIGNLRDLVGMKICGILSPNLGTDLILSQYRNPVIQPVIYSITGSMRDVYRNFSQHKCKAAILRDVAYNKLPSQERKQLRIIYKTKTMPNQAITISPRLKKYRNALSNFITSNNGAIAADKLLTRYSNKAKYFVTTTAKRYRGAEDLIEGVVYGW